MAYVVYKATDEPTMTELTLEILRAELAPMRPHGNGLPLMSRKLTVVHNKEVRAIKAAFNDFALTNPTKGEIEALHEDVNRVQAENMELATRLATVERLLLGLRHMTDLLFEWGGGCRRTRGDSQGARRRA